ncbi:MAG: ABC transporter ATP-binding protein [Verrucomicrobiota bacterium]
MITPSPDARSIVSLRAVTKRFGRRVAVNAVSFEVPRGAIYGLLGHNGAGKSTIIGMLLGQVISDAGAIFLDGHDLGKNRREALSGVGAIYEAAAFYGHLSGRKNLRILCEYTGRIPEARLEEVIGMVGLAGRIDDPVEVYSHGMRQRLALAQALLPDPKLLILDEPTEGFDPEGIFQTRNLLLRLNREWGLAIVVSSHQLSELQQICSHLAILREGDLLFAGEWRNEPAGPGMLRLKVDRLAEAEAGLRHAGLLVADVGAGLQLAEGSTLSLIARWLVEHQFRIDFLGREEKSLEDFYLETTRNGRKEP